MNWDPELYEARHGFVWKFGEDLVEFLNPQKGERILDLGCGPGQLTNKMAEVGAEVTGLDASPTMIGQARQNYPRLRFVLQDAAAMEFPHEFDAVFSNAALHWMLDAHGVVKAIAKALRIGGRLMAEMGGKGNIRNIERAMQAVLPRYYSDAIPARRTYFPALGEYASLLEANGLEVRMAQLFDRPTPLAGEDGMANWIKQFKWFYFEDLPSPQREKALAEVVEELRPALWKADGWYADYRRLRIHAVKV
jgi:trans-aconitate methyltransferase